MLVAADLSSGWAFSTAYPSSCRVKQRQVVWAVTKRDHFFRSSQFFQLPGGMCFGCRSRHDFQPLVAGIDVFLADLVADVPKLFPNQPVCLKQSFRFVNTSEIIDLSVQQLLVSGKRVITAISPALVKKITGRQWGQLFGHTKIFRRRRSGCRQWDGFRTVAGGYRYPTPAGVKRYFPSGYRRSDCLRLKHPL